MNKIFFSFLMAGIGLSAQQVEVSASYGTPSVYGLAHDLTSSIIGSVTDTQTPSSNGVAVLGIMMYSKNMKWRYGVDIANEFFSKTESVSKQNIMSLLPKVDYFWLAKEKIGLYSGGSIGVSFTHTTYVNYDKKEDKDNSTGLGFNIVPIGLRYGGDLSVFVETNVGMKGILQAGASYRF